MDYVTESGRTEVEIDKEDGWEPVLEDDLMDDEEGTVFEEVSGE
jgi:hypothetical protein